MRVNGWMISGMGEDLRNTQTVIYILEVSRMERLMATAITNGKTGNNMKVSGRTV